MEVGSVDGAEAPSYNNAGAASARYARSGGHAPLASWAGGRGSWVHTESLGVAESAVGHVGTL
jgi:hypothetical protein